ncbi:MAG TPA: LysR family transcriptional regulator [Stellaceae bacterium]|nr:LysR family transcriptional regulator [Stellaceae bacterium]
MHPAIRPGAEFSRSFTVDEGRAIGFMGPQLRVYATPSIVHDLETTCRKWLLGHIDAGEDSVGVRVEIEHRRPTPLHMSVTHQARVVAVDRGRVSFEIVVRDAVEEVARASHQRMIVEKNRLAAAIEAKRAKMGAQP